MATSALTTTRISTVPKVAPSLTVAILNRFNAAIPSTSQMANSQQEAYLVDVFTELIKRMNSRSLGDITTYASRGWELCACCRVTVGKAYSFLGRDNPSRNERLSCSHYPQFEVLLKGGHTCGLCNLFLYSIKQGEKSEKMSQMTFPNRLFEVLVMSSLVDIPTPIMVEFSIDHDSDDAILPTGLHFNILCGEEENLHWYGSSVCWSSFPDVLEIPSFKSYYIEAQPSMKTVLAWINHCNENHSICAQYRRKEWHTLPSRVIDVGAPDSLDEPHLFVSNGQQAPYMCLSHCWGDTAADMIKTTKDNLETRKTQIPLAVLPKTFADAVGMTRALNIRYLWIESMCIVQDDVDDWEIEAAAMASVYKNAYITIAAIASKDSNGGCLRPRKPFALLRSPQTGFTDPQSPSEGILFYPDPNATIYSLIDAPLYTRGWTFQEMVLSCRTLHFCEEQIVWHCLERIVTEDDVIDTPGFNMDHKMALLFYPKLGIKAGSISGVNNIDSRRSWWSML